MFIQNKVLYLSYSGLIIIKTTNHLSCVSCKVRIVCKNRIYNLAYNAQRKVMQNTVFKESRDLSQRKDRAGMSWVSGVGMATHLIFGLKFTKLLMNQVGLYS